MYEWYSEQRSRKIGTRSNLRWVWKIGKENRQLTPIFGHSMRRHRSLVLALALATAGLHAQEIEVLRLRFRSADQLLPLVQPLMAPGSALAGRGNELFLRAPSASANEIKRLIAALDHAPRALVVTISDSPGVETIHPADAAGGVTIASRDAAASRSTDANARAGNERTVSARASAQTLRVKEGERVRVALPAAIAFTFRRWTAQDSGSRIASDHAVSYEAIADFFLHVEVAGEVALLDVTPVDAAMAGAAADQSSLAAQVQARLGDWVELAQDRAHPVPAQGDAVTDVAHASAEPRGPRGVWVKINFANPSSR